MSALAVLKLVVSKKNRTVSPVIQKREKLTAKLAEQIAFFEAQQGGEIYAPKRLKTVVDRATGERAGLAKLGSPISDKKSLVFTAHSAKESNDETTQKESHSRFQG